MTSGAEVSAGSAPRERRVDQVLQGEVLTQSRQVNRQSDYRHLAQQTHSAEGPPSGRAPGLSPEQRAVATYRQTQFDALGLEHRRIDLLA